jgi:hypothetical protein
MAFTPITLVGTYLEASGAPASGTVQFELSQAMEDSTDDKIVGIEVFTCVMSSTGKISQVLYANDDSTTVPVGTSYLVTETFEPSHVVRQYSISVPHTAPGGVLDLSTVVPVMPDIALAFSTETPLADTAGGSVGTSNLVNHADHQHPTTGSPSATPRLRAYLNTAGDATANADTLLPIDTVVYDSASAFDTSTHLYTIPQTGIYEITGQVGVAHGGSAPGDDIIASVFHQGGVDCYGSSNCAVTDTDPPYINSVIATQLSCTEGDTVGLGYYSSTGFAFAISTQGNYITIVRVA